MTDGAASRQTTTMTSRMPVWTGPGGGHQPVQPGRIQPVTGRHAARLGLPAITPGRWRSRGHNMSLSQAEGRDTDAQTHGGPAG